MTFDPSRSAGERKERCPRELRVWWLFPYLGSLSIFSYLGNFGHGGILGGAGPFKDVLVGGRGLIPLWWDMACLAVCSLAVYAGAMAQGGRSPVATNAEGPRPAGTFLPSCNPFLVLPSFGGDNPLLSRHDAGSGRPHRQGDPARRRERDTD